MISHVVFRKDYRCFKDGDRFELHPGVNLLVGDQGTGKSSLLKLMIDCASRGTKEARDRLDIVSADNVQRLSVRYFDFEQMNPRVQSVFAETAGAFMFQVNSKFHSHGEMVLALLEGLPETHVLLLDEPDASLSPRSIYKIARLLRERDSKQQILVAAHNPILMEEFGAVLSLEHRRWMSAEEFLSAQKESR